MNTKNTNKNTARENTKNKARFIELDAMRGIAILAMIVYHFSFDLDYLGIKSIPVTEGWWRIFARSIATLFLLLVGMGLSISSVRQPDRTHYEYLLRGGKILACGMLITLVTLLAAPEAFIFFGILQLIGFSVMFAPWFFRFGQWNLFFGAIVIGIGDYLNQMIVSTTALAWLGIPHYGMNTLDWFPLLPWFGVALIGLAIGGFLYPDGKLRWKHEKQEKHNKIEKSIISIITPIAWLGRHSLIVYLLHQPILIFSLLLATGNFGFFF